MTDDVATAVAVAGASAERVGEWSQAATLPDADADTLARFFRVLGDATRIRILLLLLTRPRNVSELVRATGAPQSRVSNHLACLRSCGFVTARRHGREVTYSVLDRTAEVLIHLADQGITPARGERLDCCPRLEPGDISEKAVVKSL